MQHHACGVIQHHVCCVWHDLSTSFIPNATPRLWWNRLDTALRSFGLIPTRADRCCYVLYDKPGTESWEAKTKRKSVSFAERVDDSEANDNSRYAHNQAVRKTWNERQEQAHHYKRARWSVDTSWWDDGEQEVVMHEYSIVTAMESRRNE